MLVIDYDLSTTLRPFDVIPALKAETLKVIEKLGTLLLNETTECSTYVKD